MRMMNLSYVAATLRFAFRANRLWYAFIAGTLVSIVFELGAIFALVPLSSMASGSRPSPNSLVVRTLETVGIALNERTLLLMFLVMFSARILTLFATQALSAWLSRHLLAKLTSDAFENIVMHTPLRQIESKSIGSFIALAGDEASRASQVVGNLSLTFSQLTLIALYYVAIVIFSPIAGFAILIFLFVAFVCLFGSFRYTHRLGDRQSEQSRAGSSVLLDALNGLRSVRANRAEVHVTRVYRARILAYVDTLVRLDVVAQAARLGPAVLLLLLLAAVVVTPSLAEILLRDFAFLMTLILMMMRLFPVIGQTLITAMKVIADVRVGRDVTQLASGFDGAELGNASLPGALRRVEMRDVRFSHDDTVLLEDFSQVFVAGRSYAIVGPSGSGKSTLFDLVLKFCVPHHGEIELDGINTATIRPDNLRKHVILVSQDVTIFNDTVENNIKFGAECSAETFLKATQIACVEDFIDTLEVGYDTALNYRGTNLSGGQKQRIGIARALVREPDVLLLDECTSALDPVVRERIVGNLLEAFADKIIVFITHDAWVAGRVDEVVDFAELPAPSKSS